VYTVDIDVGGTLTDGLISDGQRVWAVKVDTTPHDLTVCFFDCLREAASQLGFADLRSFLDQVRLIRWSSTISTNVLAERKGPRLGLLGSPGIDDRLYGEAESPAVGWLVSRENIAPVAEPLRRDEVMARVRGLLEQGVRRVCISLRGAYRDPSQEQQIKRWLAEQYPDHYLGAVPALAGTDMVLHPDDQTRTHMALINAYVHTPLAVSLFKAEDQLLHEYGYRRPLYIGHVNGGVARVAKTRGFDTLESGPVFGVLASAYYARRYGHSPVISLDVGGTTAKVGLVVGGQPVLSPRSQLFGIPLQTPWFLLRSISLGGGSVARVVGREVRLGPESMGAYPGPACYGLGGDQATLTDALLVCGLLNPRRFLGGRRELDVQAARAALRQHVAEPLGVAVEEAALRVVDAALAILAGAVRASLAEVDLKPKGTHLYAFGGNGGLLAPSLAARLGLAGMTVFQLGHVFSAFGSSVSDICHVYEEWPDLTVDSPGAREELARRVEAAVGRVKRDLEGEGVSGDARLEVELVVGRGGGVETVRVADPADLAHLSLNGAARVQKVAVRGILPVPHYEPQAEAVRPHQAGPADPRTCLWVSRGSVTTATYTWEALRPGAALAGPAVIEADANTCAVPPGWRVTLDGFGNLAIRPDGKE
jgi:acetophenone carboxylase